jgi:hypothetical protein
VVKRDQGPGVPERARLNMLNCRVIGMAGRALASAIWLTGQARPVRTKPGERRRRNRIAPFRAVLLRVIIQSSESEVDSLMKSADPRQRGFPRCAVD